MTCINSHKQHYQTDNPWYTRFHVKHLLVSVYEL